MADSDQAPALREAAARLLKGLNAEQRLAVTAGEGATVVVAGPGSGKTRVITRRAAWLIEHGVAPSEVVLMTFTRKAAREMRERLDQLLAQSGAASGAAAAGQHRAGQIMAGTFHSLALRFLRRYSHLLNLSQNFTQIDTESRNRILRDFIKECKKAAPEGEESEKSLKPSVVGNNISRIKMMRLTPSEAQQELRRLEQHSELSPENSDLYNLLSSTLPCYEHYAAVCEREGLIDYDDMLLKCEELFSKAPHVVKPYSHILVDEFQDTNPVQYDMVRHLAHSGNLFVVGDPNQSIYGWRAAQADGYRRIFADFPGTKQVSLAENYRSTGAILSLSSDLINQNQEKSQIRLRTSLARGPAVHFSTYLSSDQEAYYTVGAFVKMLHTMSPWLRLSDFAILLRTNAMSRVFEQELSRCNLPYRMVNGVRFFEREEIADLVAYLRLVLNPDDNSAFTRVFNRPRRQLGAKALASLLESAQTDKTSLLVAAQHSSNKNARQFARIITDLRERLGHVDLPELVLHLIETIQFKEHLRRSFADKDKRNYESRLENVEELVAYARNVQEQAQEAQHEAPLDSAQPLTPQDMGLAQLRLFMDQATLHSTADVEDQDDAITLSTVHSAKGLEWAVVAIPGVEDGLYPHANAKRHRNPTKQVAALHEERRLLYVACTRAKFALLLSRAKERKTWAETTTTEPSPFLQTISAQTVSNPPTDYDWKAHSSLWQSMAGTLEPLAPELALLMERAWTSFCSDKAATDEEPWRQRRRRPGQELSARAQAQAWRRDNHSNVDSDSDEDEGISSTDYDVRGRSSHEQPPRALFSGFGAPMLSLKPAAFTRPKVELLANDGISADAQSWFASANREDGSLGPALQLGREPPPPPQRPGAGQGGRPRLQAKRTLSSLSSKSVGAAAARPVLAYPDNRDRPAHIPAEPLGSFRKASDPALRRALARSATTPGVEKTAVKPLAGFGGFTKASDPLLQQALAQRASAALEQQHGTQNSGRNSVSPWTNASLAPRAESRQPLLEPTSRRKPVVIDDEDEGDQACKTTKHPLLQPSRLVAKSKKSKGGRPGSGQTSAPSVTLQRFFGEPVAGRRAEVMSTKPHVVLRRAFAGLPTGTHQVKPEREEPVYSWGVPLSKKPAL